LGESIVRIREELERISEERRNVQRSFYELRDRIKSINDKCRSLKEEINKLREEYRKAKDDLKESIEKLRNIIYNVRERRNARRKIYEEINIMKGKATKPYSYVKNRLEKLDHMIQIHPTDPNWEKNAIQEMKQLSSDMKIYKEISKKRKLLISIRFEEETLKIEASNLRKHIDELRIKMNNIRLAIIDKKDILHRLIKEKEEIKVKLNEVANTLNKLREKERQLVEYIKTEHESIQSEKMERRLQVLKAIAEEAERKLRQGGRLTKLEIEALAIFKGGDEDG